MTSTVFTSGTVIESPWLNDVNTAVYTTVPAAASSSALAASSGSSLVGFIQSGSGAVATTVQAKLRESVSVLDFGADPTGVADSTSAFTAAIATGAAIINMPAGTFKISSTLTISRQVQLIGSGAGEVDGTAGTSTTTINYTGTGVAISLIGANVNGIDNMHLSDFHIVGTVSSDGGLLVGDAWSGHPFNDGFVVDSSFINLSFNGFTKVNAYGMRVRNVLNSYFRNLHPKNCYDGLLLNGIITTLSFHNSWFRSSVRNGFRIDADGTNGQISNVVLNDCTSEANGEAGLYLSGQIAALDFYSYHSEANNTTGGTAPIVITDNGQLCQGINFWGGVVQDKVGALQYDVTGTLYTTWTNVIVPSYAAAFIKVSSTTLYGAFNYAGVEMTVNSIVNNPYNGVSINGNIPESGLRSVRTKSNYILAGNAVTSFTFQAVTDANWKSTTIKITASASDRNTTGHVGAWWQYEIILLNANAAIVTLVDSGGTTGSFVVAISGDSGTAKQVITVSVTATALDGITTTLEAACPMGISAIF